MILTEKAKEEFEKWFEKEYRTFATSYGENVDKINNYIAIEWFDSVEIYINTTYEEFTDTQIKNLPVLINK